MQFIDWNKKRSTDLPELSYSKFTLLKCKILGTLLYSSEREISLF